MTKKRVEKIRTANAPNTMKPMSTNTQDAQELPVRGTQRDLHWDICYKVLKSIDRGSGKQWKSCTDINRTTLKFFIR